jgi:hypothetical protein
MHAVAGYISPGWANVGLGLAKQITAPYRAARATARTRARAQELLHPPNSLIDPNAAP